MSTILALSLLLLGQASIPQPVGHVNDHAGVLDEATRTEIETLLRSYEQATSVEIAVLLVESVRPEAIEAYATRVFNAWGIGKEGLDNGVLFVVATKDRRARIETGYGIEPDLTDLAARRILAYDAAPHFRLGQMADGVIEGVQAIIKELGDSPWADRLESRKLREEERRRKEATFGIAVLSVLSLGGFLLAGASVAGLLAVTLVIVSNMVREAQRKRALHERIEKHRLPAAQDRIETLKGAIQTSIDEIGATLPRWLVVDELTAYAREAEDKGRQAQNWIGQVRTALKGKDPDAAAELVLDRTAIHELERLRERLIARLDTYRRAQRAAPERIAAAATLIAAADQAQELLRSKGYRVSRAALIETARKHLDRAQAAAAGRDFVQADKEALQAFEAAEDAKDWAEGLEASVARIVERLDETERTTKETLTEQIPVTEAVLRTLAEEYPEAVWSPLKASFETVHDMAAAIFDRIALGRQLADMDTQDFDGAERAAVQAERQLETLQRDLFQPTSVLTSQETAQREWPKILKATKAAQKNATTACRQDGVPTAVKEKLQQANERFKILQSAVQEDRVDWAGVVTDATQLVKTYDAIRTAANKYAEQEKRRSYRSSYSSSSSYGGYRSSYGGGSSGFGGFGGGRSGGGGASIGW